MHFKGLDLNLLVALDLLLAERSITRASERLHLSQSAMSSALGRLRSYFDDELLVQTGRNMVPTALAEALAAPVREVLLKIDSTVRTRPQFEAATSTRHFKLLMSDYVSTVLLANLLPRLEREAPGVSLDLLPYADSHWEMLERGSADFLFIPSQYLRGEHPWEVLFEDEFVGVVWSGNALVGAQLTLEQYMALGHVAVRFGNLRAPTTVDSFFDNLGHHRRIDVVAADFNSTTRMVIGTHRIATVQRRLACYYATYLPLRVLELPMNMPRLCEIIAWHGFRTNDPGSVWLRRMMADAMRDAAPASP
ncbi:MAG: LysR family transcriptional regulator [Burkholderiaceae bacterium]|nr:LysR family transcriptional regulator [Burkholderiaceae bacterium]